MIIDRVLALPGTSIEQAIDKQVPLVLWSYNMTLYLFSCREDRNATCVIDVRDADFAGGHIEGCLNIWAESFYDDDDVDELIKKHDLLCCKRLVLTCFVSQQRGPFCARR